MEKWSLIAFQFFHLLIQYEIEWPLSISKEQQELKIGYTFLRRCQNNKILNARCWGALAGVWKCFWFLRLLGKVSLFLSYIVWSFWDLIKKFIWFAHTRSIYGLIKRLYCSQTTAIAAAPIVVGVHCCHRRLPPPSEPVTLAAAKIYHC